MKHHLRKRKALQLAWSKSWPHEFVRLSDYVSIARGHNRYVALVAASGLNLGADESPYTGPLFPMEIGRIEGIRFITSASIPD